MSSGAKEFLVGGVDQRDGTWRAVFQVHRPCIGGDHKRCVMREERVSPPCADYEAAPTTLMATRDGMKLDGWENTRVLS